MNAPLTEKERLFPIQTPGHKRGCIAESVYMAAYEVYSHIHTPQPAMIDLEGRGCRGGFGVGELIAFLYARSFPKAEWSRRADEALEGMDMEGKR